jgi:hypothetical protein
MSAPTIRRRRFQFGLGSLLMAIAMIAFFLAWETRQIRERKVARAWIVEQGGMVHVAEPDDSEWDKVSLMRQWLGDEAIGHVSKPPGVPIGEWTPVRRLFPETPRTVSEWLNQDRVESE